MPYLGYFQAIAAVDKYILYDNLPFEKKTWMTRNRIRQKDGRVEMITVPVLKGSSQYNISEVRIDYSVDWVSRLLKMITSNYGKALYFNEVYPLLRDVLLSRYETLSKLNTESIKAIAQFLDVNTVIESDNTCFLPMEEKIVGIEKDYAALPHLLKTRPETKTARIIEICKHEGSTHYVNAIGGVSLYSKDEFAEYGIKLDFIKMHPIEYNQFNNPFEPSLSIIDVLMHNGKEGTKKLLEEYTLI